MKTIFDAHAPGYVTIRYDSIHGARVTRTFTCPMQGGYVRDLQHNQVCEHLASTGPTLKADHSTLAAVIRREYRAMRRAEKRHLKGIS